MTRRASRGRSEIAAGIGHRGLACLVTAYDTTPVVYGAASSGPDGPGKLMSPAWLCPAVLKVQEFFANPAGSQPAFSKEGLFEGWASRGDTVTLEPHGFTLSAHAEAAESDMRKP